MSREVTVQVEAIADRLEVNVSQSAEEGTEVASVSIAFDEFSVEKTDAVPTGYIQAADASSAYPDLTFSLNGQDHVLSSGGTITLPYPIYAGDYQQCLHI